jgi:hypothetical protein
LLPPVQVFAELVAGLLGAFDEFVGQRQYRALVFDL